MAPPGADRSIRPGRTSCAVRGYATDTDPRGTNVRSAPRADAPIIGHLAPPTKIDANTETGIEFDIVGSKDGWLLIRNGSDGGLTFDPAHRADGRGWVSAKLVGTQLRLPAFRSAPRRDAPEIAHFQGDIWGPDSAGVIGDPWLPGPLHRGHRGAAGRQDVARLVLSAVLAANSPPAMAA